MKKIILIFIALVFLYSLIFSVNATIISNCTTINSAGTYQLNQSIVTSSINPCIEIHADDVVLDGNGYSLLFNNSYGIYLNSSTSDLDTVTIKNFSNISGNNFPIFFEYAHIRNINALTITDNNIGYGGIALGGVSRGYFARNNFVNNSGISFLGEVLEINFVNNSLPAGCSVFFYNSTSVVSFEDSNFQNVWYRTDDNNFLAFINFTGGSGIVYFHIGNDVFSSYFPIVQNNFIQTGSFNPIANESAEILFLNLIFTTPVILRNGVLCDPLICSSLQGNSSSYYFNISQGGNYSLAENSTIVISSITSWDIFDSAGAGLGMFMQTLAIALPPLLFGLALALIIGGVAWGIAEMLYRFANKNIK